MWHIISNHYVNEFRIYLFIPQIFCTVYFGEKDKYVVTLPYSAHRKHKFLGKTKEMSTTKKLPSRKKIALELLHLILGHRYTRSLLAGDTTNFWEDIELRIFPDPFCTSCQISSTNKKTRSKSWIKPKSPFKWVFIDIILSTKPAILTIETTISNYLLIVDAYSKTLKIYGIEINNNRRSCGKDGYVPI